MHLNPQLARILLADAELASRLTLKSLFSTAGYTVDGAATVNEAIGKLDTNEYELVLADLRTDSEGAGARLLSYARQKAFCPATALISSDLCETNSDPSADSSPEQVVRMSNENISYLLGRVADLIGERADRLMFRSVVRVN